MVTKIDKIVKPKNSNGRRRYNLWRQFPHCHYCGKKLEWEETTLEHLYSKVKNGKYRGKREKTKKEVGKNFTVLSCEPCNLARAHQETKELPRHIVWRKSRSFPRFFRKDLTIYERFIILWYQLTLDYKPERV